MGELKELKVGNLGYLRMRGVCGVMREKAGWARNDIPFLTIIHLREGKNASQKGRQP